MALTVEDLRGIAQNILDQLEGYDDLAEIKTSANTYRMGNTILETYDGFINYNYIEVREEEEE